MKRVFDEISQGKFDVVVIGGGVIGTGVARDAAMRGLKTVLLEKEDFGYGTTSRSTRLIHGGLRYLSHLDFKLVRQDLREREILLKIAPHLVRPLSFLLPLERLSQRFVMAVGMRLYDRLSDDKSVPSYRHLSREETLVEEPTLEMTHLTGSYRFYDCQVPFPERLSLENALSAQERGALLINHAEVVGITKEGNTIDKIRVKDCLSNETREIRGRLIINVTGHWANNILNMVIKFPINTVRTTMGVHLVTTKISNNAIVLFAKSDGRLIFVIPWHGYSLIGTTDTEYSGDTESMRAGSEDVSYLLGETKRAFPHLTTEDIHYAFAGLRSLVGSHKQRVSNISRSHKLVDHEVEDGVSGIISILGGKMTGHRSIAEEAVDLACSKLGIQATCNTAQTPLPGAPVTDKEAIDKMASESGLSSDTLNHLDSLYGRRMKEVIDLAGTDARGKQVVCPHSKDILAQVWHAVQEESCMTVSDFMLRRGTVGLASCQGLDAVETIGLEMGRLLEWSIGEWKSQVEDYRSIVELRTRFRGTK
jgi:glycerol-3-phosphate dehydrogenase